jgi:hypothetical protein
MREAEEWQVAETKKKTSPLEEKLVDGKLTFANSEEDDVILPRDDLVEGHKLPKALGRFPKNLAGVPLEEIDPGISDKVKSRGNKFIFLSYEVNSNRV